MQGGPPAASCLRQHESAGSKLESRQGDSAGWLGCAGQPTKAASDHQVNDDEDLTDEFQHDALADAVDADHDSALRMA